MTIRLCPICTNREPRSNRKRTKDLETADLGGEG